ncbi:NAD(P)/FAD-dependent oxidoreductase [Arthrobacter sp. KK5.5]|uniref:NAD(P)/FAD-dependent oxidoreductase n=1 Tax=Arthrobacter sp. KK5.5 TaxID=3373084 RepID=UPI003EE6865B
MSGGDSGAGVLIAGAGQAGVELAAALRAAGWDAPITLVGAEARPPYQRPPLSKGWLAPQSPDQQDQATRSIELRVPAWFAANGIDLFTGDPIARIGRTATGGGLARTATGRALAFDRLALATGASPRRIAVPGADLAGVRYLRTADDAVALADELATATTVAVVGGGFIGLEVAVAARKAGAAVTVIEASPRLIGRAVSEQTSEFYLQAHRRRGIDVVLNARIEAFEGDNGRVAGVRLSGGGEAGASVEPAGEGRATVVPADIVVVGIGVVPSTALAEGLGLEVDNGVVVDGRMLCSDGATVAVGDCANMPLPGAARGPLARIRLESVPNAAEQARIAAATLMGEEAAYDAVPWFWSDQGDLKLQIAGISAGHDQVVLRGNPGTERFSVLYYRDGRILAADCINNPRDFMAVKAALRTGGRLPAGPAADPAVPLTELLKVPAGV